VNLLSLSTFGIYAMPGYSCTVVCFQPNEMYRTIHYTDDLLNI